MVAGGGGGEGVGVGVGVSGGVVHCDDNLALHRLIAYVLIFRISTLVVVVGGGGCVGVGVGFPCDDAGSLPTGPDAHQGPQPLEFLLFLFYLFINCV